MLARQAWRMLINLDSLCAKVLKAKYFPDTSILDAILVRGMSYSWRSILKGLELVKKGMIWRVGDGSNINIWSDNWLPRDDAMRPITPRRQCVLTKVSKLINPIAMSWDEEILREKFFDMDVQAILAIPIREDFNDFVAWQFDSKGDFSVKSAYRLYV
jgi:hypothetical protein